MQVQFNRRQMMSFVGGIAAAGATSSLMAAAGEKKPGAATPWKYEALDPDVVAQRAFDSYLKGHCMYGSFEAIVGLLGDRFGAPYTSFPFEMFEFGAGGVNGWGTLCGALNGSVAAVQLLSPQPGPVIDTLMSWYQTEPLPNFYPKGAKFAEVRSVAGTPLCHESIAHWTEAAHKKAYSPERSERCGTLTSSVARKTVLLLNDQAQALKLAGFTPSKQTQACMSCHEKGGKVENIRTKMDCSGCHSDTLGTGHGRI